MSIKIVHHFLENQRAAFATIPCGPRVKKLESAPSVEQFVNLNLARTTRIFEGRFDEPSQRG